MTSETAHNAHWYNLIFVDHPLQVPDSAILECTTITDLSGKDFMNPQDDKTSIGKKDPA